MTISNISTQITKAVKQIIDDFGFNNSKNLEKNVKDLNDFLTSEDGEVYSDSLEKNLIGYGYSQEVVNIVLGIVEEPTTPEVEATPKSKKISKVTEEKVEEPIEEPSTPEVE